jgi:hypothetical protein
VLAVKGGARCTISTTRIVEIIALTTISSAQLELMKRAQGPRYPRGSRGSAAKQSM